MPESRPDTELYRPPETPSLRFGDDYAGYVKFIETALAVQAHTSYGEAYTGYGPERTSTGFIGLEVVVARAQNPALDSRYRAAKAALSSETSDTRTTEQQQEATTGNQETEFSSYPVKD